MLLPGNPVTFRASHDTQHHIPTTLPNPEPTDSTQSLILGLAGIVVGIFAVILAFFQLKKMDQQEKRRHEIYELA